MRLFIAIELPSTLQRHLAALQADMREVVAGGLSLPREEQLHITLKFLGEIDENLLPQVHDIFVQENRAASFGTLRLGPLGAFPDVREPRVIWVGLEGAAAVLAQLADQYDAAFEVLGVQREARKFSPHITIARNRSAENFEILRRFMKRVQVPQFEFTPERAALFRSRHDGDGHIYEIVG